jgi:hypothetical protein
LRERRHEADRLDGVPLRPDAACCRQQRYGYDNESFHVFPSIRIKKTGGGFKKTAQPLLDVNISGPPR